jgi:pyridinium-3,5-biscarboxylic acid mononucleotide synthase
MTEFRIDWERAGRCGTTEAVLCAPKSAAQIDAIIEHARALERRLLLTRLGPRKLARLSLATRAQLDYDEATRTAILGGLPKALRERRVAIVCGGTSDLAVAGEAARTLAFAGESATLLADVGVAGLWRLMERLDEIRSHNVVIVVAGMEGALFSVLAGLVSSAVIAVPTSIGYGVAEGGRTALNAALASCASGLTVVNIDNGFGAAHAALRILGAQQRTGDDARDAEVADHRRGLE